MKSVRFFFALLLVLSLLTVSPLVAQQPTPPPSAPQVHPEVKEALEKSLGKFNSADIEGAYDALNAVYAKHKNTMAPPRVVLARFFAAANIPQGVLNSLERGVLDMPNDPEAYILLAEVLLAQGCVTAADELLNKADSFVNTIPDQDRRKNLTLASLRHRIGVYQNRGQWAKVAEGLQRVIQIEGRTPILLRQLAIAMFRQDNKEAEARNLFVEANNIKSEENANALPPDALMSQLHLSRNKEGDRAKALSMLNDAMRAAPNSPGVLAYAVNVYLINHDLAKAKEIVSQLYEVEKKNAEGGGGLPGVRAFPTENTAKLLAQVYLFDGNWTGAESYYQYLVVNSPNDAEAVNGLALALCEQKDPTDPSKKRPDPEKIRRAFDYAVSNVQKNERNPALYATLGWVLYQSGRLQEAQKALRQASPGGNVSLDTAYYLARILADQLPEIKDVAQKNQTHRQAYEILKKAIESNQPFFKRSEAGKLLGDLEKNLPAATP